MAERWSSYKALIFFFFLSWSEVEIVMCYSWNFLLALMFTSRGALEVARAGGLLGKRHRAGESWSDFGPQISDIQQNLCASFSSFKIENWPGNVMDLSDMRNMLVSNSKRVTDHLQRVRENFSPRDSGMFTYINYMWSLFTVFFSWKNWIDWFSSSTDSFRHTTNSCLELSCIEVLT